MEERKKLPVGLCTEKDCAFPLGTSMEPKGVAPSREKDCPDGKDCAEGNGSRKDAAGFAGTCTAAPPWPRDGDELARTWTELP